MRTVVLDAWAGLALLRNEAPAAGTIRRYLRRSFSGNTQLAMSRRHLHHLASSQVGSPEAGDGSRREPQGCLDDGRWVVGPLSRSPVPLRALRAAAREIPATPIDTAAATELDLRHHNSAALNMTRGRNTPSGGDSTQRCRHTLNPGPGFARTHARTHALLIAWPPRWRLKSCGSLQIESKEVHARTGL